jgi:hypothetical protein
MPRAIFKLNNGDFINVPADAIDVRENWICAWDGEDIVAIVKEGIVDSCHLSKQKEEK